MAKFTWSTYLILGIYCFCTDINCEKLSVYAESYDYAHAPSSTWLTAWKLKHNKMSSSLHLKFFIGDPPWAAATATRAVATVLIIILLRVVLGTREAPTSAGSSKRIAFQIQVLLAYEQNNTEHLQLLVMFIGYYITYMQAVFLRMND